MGNSILETMQGIGNEAKQVLGDYDVQIRALEEKLAQEIAQLKESLAKTITQNESNVRSVLTDKKDDLVQQIVDRVVEKYGY